MLFLHILAGFIAIGAGAVALSARKGALLHRRSGKVFVAAMLAMLSFGGAMAAGQMFDEPIHRMNVVAASFTTYLVVTSLLTVRRPVEQHRWMHTTAMAFALAVGVLALVFGAEASNSKAYGPPSVYFTFGGLALLAAGFDARVLRAGRIEGDDRIARHLWRMTLAMLIATASFFLGQADEFPAPLRNVALLSAPVVLVLVSLIYWLVRVRLQARRSRGLIAAHPSKQPATPNSIVFRLHTPSLESRSKERSP